jgi:hypothetical protein
MNLKLISESLLKTEPISCVAQQILNDLDVKNVDKWKEILNPNSIILKYNCKYSLSYIYNNVRIREANGFKFNFNENKLIFDAMFKIFGLKNKQKEEKEQDECHKKLKELFPDCFPQKTKKLTKSAKVLKEKPFYGYFDT